MNQGQDTLKNSAPSLDFFLSKTGFFLVVVEGFFPFIFFLSERWRRVVRDSPQGEGEESGAFN